MTTRRRAAAFSALAISALMLAGCAAGASDEAYVEGPPFGGESVESQSGGDGGFAEEAADLDSSPSDDADRSVVTTGYLYVTAEAPLDAADEAVTIAERAGGRVDARQEFAPSGGDAGGAELTLRIPAERLTATLDELEALGEVEELSLGTVDVTREVQDVDARIAALRSSIGRLLDLQGGAGSIEDLIALETAISDRQAELESLEARQRSLSDQVSLSTITLTLGSERVAPVDEPDTFLTGLIAGWESLVAFGSGLLVVLGVLLPWLVLLGVIALVVLALVRRARRRRAVAPTSRSDESLETAAEQQQG